MNIDFIDDKYRFNARSCAIIYNKNKIKVLLFKADETRDFYMLPGGTIMYCGVYDENEKKEVSKTAVIPYGKMADINDISQKYDCHMWLMEQTKEARFMPSLNQDKVQIGIIFNADLVKKSTLLIGDILDTNNFDDNIVKDFVNPNYYEKFIKDRAKKDDFFTNRESAVLFGIPSNLIEGILVGKTYEKDQNVLKEIKEILPNCYICNLEGTVIF